MKPPMHDPITLMQPAMIKDVHTVQSGDTLSGIALDYDVTTTAIKIENNLGTGDSIFVGQSLTIPNPHIEKSDRGIISMDRLDVMARVEEDSTLIIDDKGQKRQATYKVILPPDVTPNLGDEIQIGADTVTILKRKARQSYSGKKIYYWVTNCGT